MTLLSALIAQGHGAAEPSAVAARIRSKRSLARCRCAVWPSAGDALGLWGEAGTVHMALLR